MALVHQKMLQLLMPVDSAPMVWEGVQLRRQEHKVLRCEDQLMGFDGQELPPCMRDMQICQTVLEKPAVHNGR